MQETKELAELFGGLQAGLNALREVRGIYDERVAFAFNSVNFFEPNENKTSEILAFFLDPQKEHGQKDAFLRVFLKYLDLQPPLSLLLNGRKATTRTEHRTDTNRRVDITVEFGDGEYIVGIENKIWAADQKNQVSDYTKYLETHFRTNAYTLLFLTPDGREPGDESIAESERKILIEDKRLRIVSYEQDIIELLSQFELVCKAENVRAFIRDLREYLKQQYRGETIMGETDYVAKYVTEDRRRLELALDVLDAADCIRQAVWDGFKVELEQFAKANDMALEFEPSIASCGKTYDKPITLRPKHWARSRIWVEFGSKHMANALLLLDGGSTDGFPMAIMKAAAERSKATFQESNGNVYMQLKYQKSWRDSAEPWRDMLARDTDGRSEFMKHLGEMILVLARAVKDTAETNGYDVTT